MDKEKRPIGLQNNLDKILFILATGYFIGVAAWFIKQAKLQPNIAANKPPEISPSSPTKLSKEETPEIQPEVKIDTQKIDLNPKSNSMPFPLIQKTLPNILPTQPINVNDNLNNSSSIASIPPISPPPPLPSLTQPLTPLKPVVNQPIKVPMPPPPTISYRPQNPSTPNVKNTPIVEQNNNKNTNIPTIPPSSSPLTSANLNNILVGLVEFEDQSIVLFKTNNVDQRVKIGEQIGATGWTLVSVNGENKQAIISRNGETIRITFGEKF